jgi:hypothetical protein
MEEKPESSKILRARFSGRCAVATPAIAPTEVSTMWAVTFDAARPEVADAGRSTGGEAGDSDVVEAGRAAPEEVDQCCRVLPIRRYSVPDPAI